MSRYRRRSPTPYEQPMGMSLPPKRHERVSRWVDDVNRSNPDLPQSLSHSHSQSQTHRHSGSNYERWDEPSFQSSRPPLDRTRSRSEADLGKRYYQSNYPDAHLHPFHQTATSATQWGRPQSNYNYDNFTQSQRPQSMYSDRRRSRSRSPPRDWSIIDHGGVVDMDRPSHRSSHSHSRSRRSSHHRRSKSRGRKHAPPPPPPSLQPISVVSPSTSAYSPYHMAAAGTHSLPVSPVYALSPSYAHVPMPMSATVPQQVQYGYGYGYQPMIMVSPTPSKHAYSRSKHRVYYAS